MLIEQINALLHLLDYNTGKGSQLDPCWHQTYHITAYQQQRNVRKVEKEKGKNRVRKG